MKLNDTPIFDLKVFLSEAGKGRTLAAYKKNQVVFSQGDPANAVFYIQKGRVKLTVVSNHGQEAVVAILAAGDFFGEGCLASQMLRMASATTMADCSIMRLEKTRMMRALHDETAVCELLVAHLLFRTIPISQALFDH